MKEWAAGRQKIPVSGACCAGSEHAAELGTTLNKRENDEATTIEDTPGVMKRQTENDHVYANHEISSYLTSRRLRFSTKTLDDRILRGRVAVWGMIFAQKDKLVCYAFMIL